MSQNRIPLDYARRTTTHWRWSPLVISVSLLAVAAGVIVSFLGTAGVDNHEQILVGCGIAALGIVCTIQGFILKVLEAP